MHALQFDLSRMLTFTLLHSSLSPFFDLCRQPGEIHPLARKLPPATDGPLLEKCEMERDEWQGLHELEGPRLRAAAERSRLIKIDRRSDSLSPSLRHSSGDWRWFWYSPLPLWYSRVCVPRLIAERCFFLMCYSVDKSTPPHSNQQQRQHHSWVQFSLPHSQHVLHCKQVMRQTKGSS